MNCVHNKKADASLFISPRAAEVSVPEEDREDNPMEDERDGGSPDPHDDADFGFDHAALPRLSDGALDPLAAFIKELEGLSNMTGPDISDIIDDLPIPLQQEVESMSVHDAVQV